MTEGKKEFKLTPDHFQLNERGELVIKNAEIAELVRAKTEEVKRPEAGGISVEVSVGVSIP